MSTSSNDEPITQARWAADGRSVSFLGRNRDSQRHLFLVHIEGGKLEQLTGEGRDVTDFDQANDSQIVPLHRGTSGDRVPALSVRRSDSPDQEIGTGRSLFQLLYPEWESFTFGVKPRQVLSRRGGKISPVLQSGKPLSIIGSSYEALLALSPSGRSAVVTNMVDAVPPAWESYEPAFEGGFSQRLSRTNRVRSPQIDFYRPLQYQLLDVASGKMSPLIEAPLGRSAGYSDGPRVAGLATKRGRSRRNSSTRRQRIVADVRRPCVAVVELSTRRIECVQQTPKTEAGKAFGSLSGLEWRRDIRSSSPILEPPQPRGIASERSGEKRGRVKRSRARNRPVRARPLVAADALDFGPSELNEPPVLTATDHRQRKILENLGPDPQLATIRLGEASIYHWHDGAGREWTGGLVKPPDFVAGHRYPLVIQTHGFRSDEFLMEGIFTTANAARPMAARGIVVLQVGEITTNALAGPREPFENGTAGYIAAIDQLVGEGIVDPSKIGIIGFSRTGWYVLDSLIHQPERFAAATLAECTYESYGEYIMNADYLGPQRAKGIAEGIGPDPFGPGLAKWISDSPGFNTDKIRVPVFFEFHSPVSVVYGWDVYAALRLQGKPVDLLYFRNGEHVLAKPKERLSSQQMNVDWFDFWLNGHEDPDPAKAEQYARWRALRPGEPGHRRDSRRRSRPVHRQKATSKA